MADSAHHCPTCTCQPDTHVFCESEVMIRHEKFGCLEVAGHGGPHKGSTADAIDFSTRELIWTDSGEILTEGVKA